jgi:hypothetical protein
VIGTDEGHDEYEDHEGCWRFVFFDLVVAIVLN